MSLLNTTDMAARYFVTSTLRHRYFFGRRMAVSCTESLECDVDHQHGDVWLAPFPVTVGPARQEKF